MVTVKRYNQMSFLVESQSRPGNHHLVDFEGFDGIAPYCSCEAFTLGKQRPCKHIIGLVEMICVQK